MATLLVTGNRHWTDRASLYRVLDAAHKEHKFTLVVHGAYHKGADKMADDWAKSRQIPCKPVHAQWRTYGPKAGPIRNLAMLDANPEALVYAFMCRDEANKGTKHCVAAALASGHKVVVTWDKPEAEQKDLF